MLRPDELPEPRSRFSWDSFRSLPREIRTGFIQRLRTAFNTIQERSNRNREEKQAKKAAKKAAKEARNVEAAEKKRIKRLRAYQRKALLKERKAMVRGASALAEPDRALVRRQLGMR